MLTIFTTPKPFRGHIEVIQRNAIHSWTLLRPGCEIILFGDDEGTAEIAAELGVRHVSEVVCNEYGTPLLNDIFEKAHKLASRRLLCYVNADIILLDDFMDAVQRVRLRRFLMVGQRWDLDIDESLSFEQIEWRERLLKRVDEEGVLHPPFGSDYFLFPRSSRVKLPRFAVGRPAWDNWLIYHTRAQGVPVVDATASVRVVHQNHGYRHVVGGSGEDWEGPEAERNRALAGGLDRAFTPDDATHLLKPRRLERALDQHHMAQRLRRLDVLDPSKGVLRKLRRKMLWWVNARRNLFPEYVWQRLMYTLSF